MTPPRWRRILHRVGIALVGLAIAIAAYIPIQQQILRWRAERLLADIHALQMGKSTWGDAQRLMNRWGASGFYEGSCSSSSCNYQIVLQDASRLFPNYSEPNGTLHSEGRGCCAWWLRPYQMLGGRPSLIGARIVVLRQRVWGKYFEELVPLGGKMEESGDLLLGTAQTNWRSEDFHGLQSMVHPDYEADHAGACSGCDFMRVTFTPFADPVIVNDLMDFNLACLTKLFGCSKPEEIMPNAWKEHIAEKWQEKLFELHPREASAGCPLSPEFVGRDRVNVVIADVESVRILKDKTGPYTEVCIRITEQLKRARPEQIGSTYVEWMPVGPLPRSKAERVAEVGFPRKLIIAYSASDVDGRRHRLTDDLCDMFPYTDETNGEVKSGAVKDIFPLVSPRFP